MYTDLQTTVSNVIQNCQLDINDSFSRNRIEKWLIERSGIKNNPNGTITVIYREYYVTALEFWLRPENNLTAGEGAKFDQNTTVARRWANMQLAVDNALQLKIDPAFTVATFIKQLHGEDCTDCGAVKEGIIGFLSF